MRISMLLVAIFALSFTATHLVFADAQPTSQPAANLPSDAPSTPQGALKKSGEVISMAKAGNWWGMSAGLIWILMYLLKAFGLFKKIGKRWAYIVVPILSITAMLLARFAGDLSWAGALTVLTSGPTAALANDFIKRGVLGKEPTTTIKVIK